MKKPCYTEYVRHILRFYSRYLHNKTFKTHTDRQNWWACHTVLEGYSARDKDIFTFVYGEYDTIADNVYVISKKLKIHQNIIWDMMKELEKKVAIERGIWE